MVLTKWSNFFGPGKERSAIGKRARAPTSTGPPVNAKRTAQHGLSPLRLHLNDRIPQTPPPHDESTDSFCLVVTMSDDRGKGISLRKKRTDKRPKGGAPTISAPRQISAPMPTGLAAATLSSSGRPSNESSRSGKRLDAPRERPQRADKTADLVKRRYSQRITQLPSDFGNGAPMPDMPQIPDQFREAPPSRDGRPPGSSDGRGIKVDKRALEDPSLKPDQCEQNL
jgi:hypothetical protein